MKGTGVSKKRAENIFCALFAFFADFPEERRYVLTGVNFSCIV